MYEVCGAKELKTLLAIEQGDSIAGVARKIDENRETIRRAVNVLEEAGFVVYEDGLAVVEPAVRETALAFLGSAATVSGPTISESYVLPQFSGLDYAYTALDAVYVWTRGGYQVARDETDYPLFIAVRETDVDEWEKFFEKFGIPVAQERQPPAAVDGAVQVVLSPRPALEWEVVDGRPVIPLSETIAFAQDHYATFESALEILDQMYDEVETDADYRRRPA